MVYVVNMPSPARPSGLPSSFIANLRITQGCLRSMEIIRIYPSGPRDSQLLNQGETIFVFGCEISLFSKPG
jgi:hypothetical protein